MPKPSSPRVGFAVPATVLSFVLSLAVAFGAYTAWADSLGLTRRIAVSVLFACLNAATTWRAWKGGREDHGEAVEP